MFKSHRSFDLPNLGLLALGVILVAILATKTNDLNKTYYSHFHSVQNRQNSWDASKKHQLEASLARLPLSFEANQGQVNSQVRFLSRGRGYNLFLTATRALLALQQHTPQQLHFQADHLQQIHGKRLMNIATNSSKDSISHLPYPARSSSMLSMSLVGANPHASVRGEQLLSGKSHYLIGHNPRQWHTNVSQFAKVRYHKVYPGIDLVYYGNQQQLEYDFVVAPGADPHQISLSFDGLRAMSLDSNGELVLATEDQRVRWHKPLIYQQVNGTRHLVTGGYMFRGTRQIGFRLAAYDTRKPLIIDPTLSYSTYLGGMSEDDGWGLAVDSAGNAYVAGSTLSLDFPTQNPVQGVGAGNRDIFITKINAAGSAIVYSTYLGGNNIDYALDLKADSSGNAYVTGYTLSSDFPTFNALQPQLAGFGGTLDAFITKLNPSGNNLLFSTYLGDRGNDLGLNLALDTANNIYVTGQTDFHSNVIAGTSTNSIGSSSGNGDIFLAKLNAGGSSLAYYTYLGGSGYESPGDGNCLAVDSNGNTYLTGATDSTDFPLSNSYQVDQGGRDAFLCKVNASGSALLFSTYLGGSAEDRGEGVTIDSSGNICMTGYTGSNDFPIQSALQTSRSGSMDGFVAKFPAGGSVPIYCTYLGGTGADCPYSIAVDGSGRVYVTGQTNSTNFPVQGALQATSGGGNDVFLTALKPDGTGLTFSSYFGGSGDEFANRLSVDSTNNVYLCGQTTSANFPTASPAQGSYKGNTDTFIAKINISPASSPLVVTTTKDIVDPNDGQTSLREAINYANGHEGSTISFNIPLSDAGFSGGVFTCKPISALPNITANGTVIDGNSQTTFSGDTNPAGPEIVVNGSLYSGGSLFTLNAANGTVQGLVLNGSNGNGISILGVGATGNHIQSCYIGCNATGTAAVSNFTGIAINNGASLNIIGGTTASLANRILYNNYYGIYVGGTGTGNTIRGNSIAHNGITQRDGAVGINLASPNENSGDVTSNDSGDGDTGPNNLQNFPVLQTVVQSKNLTNNVNITGTLNSNPNSTYVIDFYRSTAPSYSGFGEGEVYLGSVNITTDTAGNASFNASLSGFVAQQYFTAIATNLKTGDSSEFSYYRQGIATAIVTNTSDNGPGSLRAAILFANANAPATINFNIPTSDPNFFNNIFVIRPSSDLPAIIGDDITVDGSTQTQFSGDTNPDGPEIWIQGAGNSNGPLYGFTIDAKRARIKGFVLSKFYLAAIHIQAQRIWTNGNNSIQSCYIGTDPTGAQAMPNGIYGILIDHSDGNTIGDDGNGNTATGLGNVISCSNYGIYIIGSVFGGNRILGNLIGTNSTGTAALGSQSYGVYINSASHVSIGSGSIPQRNIIAGNSIAGIYIAAQLHSASGIYGNFIGTDKSGMSAIPNGTGIILAGGTQDTLVGHTYAGYGNLISGNSGDGVLIVGENTPYSVYQTTGNLVQHNLIGTNAAGTAPLGNGNNGVHIVAQGQNNSIGGLVSQAANTIAYNGGDGVNIEGSGTINNVVRGNAIYQNNGLGINLALNGESPHTATPNDSGDADTGPNNAQNFPVLSNAVTKASGTSVHVALNSTPNNTYSLDFYVSQDKDGSGFGEGQTYLCTQTITTDSSGNADFDFTLPVVVPLGQFLTATATDGSGNTSEFCAATQVVAPNSPPTATVQLSPATPKTNDLLTATVKASDPDGNAVKVTYVWTKTVNGNTTTLKTTGPTSSLTDTLDLSRANSGDKGDAITVEVTPNDGTVNGATVADHVTVINSAPVINSVVIEQSSPKTNDMLSVTVNSSDVDGDAITYSYQWLKNNIAINGATNSTLDLAQADNGDKGDSISVRVVADDGTLVSASASSAPVQIVNSAPTATLTLNPPNPTTNQMITATAVGQDGDGDPVTFTYTWKKNGTVIPAQTSNVLDLSQAGYGDKDDVITVAVTPNDGTVDGVVVTATAKVADSAPVAGTASISPDRAHTGDKLTATYDGFSDADGDPFTYSYQWLKLNPANSTFEPLPGATDSTYAGPCTKGEQYQVTVTGLAGGQKAVAASAVVIITNSPPVVDSVIVTPDNPTTTQLLTAHVSSHDADGDAITYSYQWLKNNVAIPDATDPSLDLSQPGNGDKNDALSVTVVAHDGTVDSKPFTSVGVVVADSIPTVDSVEISPSSPQTNDTLSVAVTSNDADGDTPITYTYQWLKNGTAIAGENAVTLDLSQVGNGDKGDVVSVQVVAHDDVAASATLTSSAVRIIDTTPVAGTASITPTPAYGGDTLAAVYAGFSDADNDTFTYSYQWFKFNTADNNFDVIPAATNSTYGGGLTKGEQYKVTVTGTAGGVAATAISAALTISNSAPTATVALSPINPTTNQTLMATVSRADIDDDAVALTYVWKNNGTTVRTITKRAGNASDLTDTLDLNVAGNGDKGNVITVAVTPNDGMVGGVTVFDHVTVANSAPVLSLVSIKQSSPRTNDTLSVIPSSSDADRDTLGYTYQWLKNGVDIIGATGPTLDLSQVGNGDKGDRISVRVTAGDGTATSIAMTSVAVTIVNSAPVSTTDNYTASKGQPLIVSSPGLLANDTDADDDLLTATVQTNPANGTLTVNADGSFVYTPHSSFVGTDSFTYAANDGSVNGNVATATITVVDPKKTNSVVFSSGTADFATNQVTLTFTGALDATSASDPATYSVDVYRTPKNGSQQILHFTVVSASYKATTHTVTLEVNGVLQKKDSVVVNWINLVTSQGTPLTGQSSAITAK